MIFTLVPIDDGVADVLGLKLASTYDRALNIASITLIALKKHTGISYGDRHTH